MKRDLALLVGGSAVSFAGDAIALVAVTLRLQPHGAGWVGALLAAELLPSAVLAPLSGRLVDRVETRRLLLVLMAVQALVALALAFASTPVLVVVLAGLLGTAAAFVGPAGSSFVPVVAGDDAARGFRLLSTSAGLGFVVGPALGGLLVGAIGTRGAILVDAATFGVLAVTRLALRARRHPAPSAKGAVHGRNPVWRTRPLAVAVGATALALTCAVVDNVAAPFRMIEELDGSAQTFGTYLTVWSVGVVVGAPLTGRFGVPARALAVGNLVIGIGIAGIGLAPSIPWAFVAAAVGGLGNGVMNAAQGAVVASQVPNAEHGRAFATVGAALSVGMLTGTLVGPLLVDALHAGGAMTLAGCLTVAVALPLAVGRTRSTAPTRVPA